MVGEAEGGPGLLPSDPDASLPLGCCVRASQFTFWVFGQVPVGCECFSSMLVRPLETVREFKPPPAAASSGSHCGNSSQPTKGPEKHPPTPPQHVGQVHRSPEAHVSSGKVWGRQQELGDEACRVQRAVTRSPRRRGPRRRRPGRVGRRQAEGGEAAAGAWRHWCESRTQPGVSTCGGDARRHGAGSASRAHRCRSCSSISREPPRSPARKIRLPPPSPCNG